MRFTMEGVPDGFVALLGDRAKFSECTKIYRSGENLPEGFDFEGWYYHLVPALIADDERQAMIEAIFERRLPLSLRGPTAMSDEAYREEIERLSDTELLMRFEED